MVSLTIWASGMVSVTLWAGSGHGKSYYMGWERVW